MNHFSRTTPLSNGGNATVANECISRLFTTSGARRTLWHHKGLWYRYDGRRWNRWGEEELTRFLFRELQGAEYTTSDGGQASLPLSRKLVAEVIAILDANLQLDGDLPRWRRDGDSDADYCIGFQNTVISLLGGTPQMKETSSDWIDPVQIPVSFTGEEPHCPRWISCLQEWSLGNDDWISLLQEWMGYCLLPTTRYARWMMMKGPVRCGKGTITKVLQMLLGDENCVNYSLADFTDPFGLDGVQGARCLVVNEVSDLRGSEGERATQILKSIIGEDPVRVNRKYQRAQTNVRLRVKPTLVTNQTVRLPNKGRGLSSKMLILPFSTSYLGHEDEHLIDALGNELEGIAAWCVEGARRLVENRGRFTTLEQAEEERREYLLENNPWDQFLEARFVQRPNGFVPGEILWNQFESWKRYTGSPLSSSRNRLMSRILEEGSWTLQRFRPAPDAPRGLKGLSLRSRPDDTSQ